MLPEAAAVLAVAAAAADTAAGGGGCIIFLCDVLVWMRGECGCVGGGPRSESDEMIARRRGRQRTQRFRYDPYTHRQAQHAYCTCCPHRSVGGRQGKAAPPSPLLHAHQPHPFLLHPAPLDTLN